MLLEISVEGRDLMHVAGVAVEQEAVGGVVLVEAIDDDSIGQLVGDEVPGIHNGLDLLAQLSAVLDVGTEHVAGGDRGHGAVLSDGGGLSSLACARGAHDQQSHDDRNPS